MPSRRLSEHLAPLLWSLTLLTSVGVSVLAVPGPEGLFGAFLAATMIAIAAIDMRRYVIPNELTAAAVLLALVRAAFFGFDPGSAAVASAIVGAAIGSLPLLALLLAYRRWRGRDGIGLGDVKLAAVAGVWLGLQTIFIVIEIAALAAILAHLAHAFFRRRPLRGAAFLPFGAFLAPAIWLGWLYDAGVWAAPGLRFTAGTS